MKSSFSKCFLHENEKPAFSNSSFPRAFRELHFRDGLVVWRSNRRNKAAFSNLSGVVWKGPYIQQEPESGFWFSRFRFWGFTFGRDYSEEYGEGLLSELTAMFTVKREDWIPGQIQARGMSWEKSNFLLSTLLIISRHSRTFEKDRKHVSVYGTWDMRARLWNHPSTKISAEENFMLKNKNYHAQRSRAYQNI